MDYEKAYKRLVGAIKNEYLYAQTNSTKNVLEEILPELKESEDEKIRKNCIHFLELQKQHHASTFEIDDCIAWLEKQKQEQKFDAPNGSIKDDESITSRMKYIPEQLKPIAEFVIRYAHWNLHSEEWNHPVPEVPLFRVLDALAQNGEPYKGG